MPIITVSKQLWVNHFSECRFLVYMEYKLLQFEGHSNRPLAMFDCFLMSQQLAIILNAFSFIRLSFLFIIRKSFSLWIYLIKSRTGRQQHHHYHHHHHYHRNQILSDPLWIRLSFSISFSQTDFFHWSFRLSGRVANIEPRSHRPDCRRKLPNVHPPLTFLWPTKICRYIFPLFRLCFIRFFGWRPSERSTRMTNRPLLVLG